MAILGFILDLIPRSFPTNGDAPTLDLASELNSQSTHTQSYKMAGFFAFVGTFFLLIAAFKPDFGRTGGLSRRALRILYSTVGALALIGGLLFALQGLGLINLSDYR